MKKIKTCVVLAFFMAITIENSNAQIAINNSNLAPHGSAMLDITAKDKGVLIPRLTTSQREAIAVTNGLLAYDQDTNSFWYVKNNRWTEIATSIVPDTRIPIPIRYQGQILEVHPTENGQNVDWANAVSICENLIAFGNDDWFLPSKLQLDALYKQSYLITDLSQTASAKYWSSSEQDVDNAYTQRLDYGGPDPDDKTVAANHNCRCVRRAN